jgi:hypothetical protein
MDWSMISLGNCSAAKKNYCRRRRTIRSFAAGLVFFSWLTAATAADYTLWYEPSNGKQAGGSLPDFMKLFDPENVSGWPNAQRNTSVLLLRINTLRNAERERPGFIASSLAPFLARTGMKFGIDTGIATFALCRASEQNAKAISHELNLLRRIENAGIKIAFIGLQSSLSKLRNERTECPQYSLADRIKDITWYISTVRSGLAIRDNSTQFGLMDASLAKGQKWVQKYLGVNRLEDAYEQLLAALASRSLRLDFVQLDHPWEAFHDFNPRSPTSLAEVAQFQAWLEKRGIASGVFLTSVRSSTEAEFREKVLQVVEGLKSVGAPGRQFVLASWSTMPTTELPENPTEPGRYPMTRILKEVGRSIQMKTPPADMPSKSLH